MKLNKNDFWLGGIQPPPVLPDCPNCPNKGAFLIKQRALFGEQFNSILSL